jgi:hypothetical protein
VAEDLVLGQLLSVAWFRFVFRTCEICGTEMKKKENDSLL